MKNEINYVNGRKEGVAKSFFKNGELWKKVHYKEDKLHGVAEVYDRQGHLLRSVTYKNGREHGPYIKYFKSGNEKLRLHYAHGRPLPGLMRKNYKGELIPEPKIVLDKLGKVPGRQVLYRSTFALDEKVSKVVFYALPVDSVWEELSNFSKNNLKLPTVSGNPKKGRMDHFIEPGYFITVEVDIYAEFEIGQGRKAVQKKRVTYSMENPAP
ncbi:MAG: hypothetical protein U5L96_14210 [Owenweeksia sp.]|nr:hypothetical protein [Owenweeksia sp.]